MVHVYTCSYLLAIYKFHILIKDFCVPLFFKLGCMLMCYQLIIQTVALINATLV